MFLKIVDFGLVVLTWMVQLIVYPSFLYYAKADLLRWHPKYTTAITLVVMPLMFGQLFGYGFAIVRAFSWLRLAGLVLVLATWLVTFTHAVPLHNAIAQGNGSPEVIHRLINAHWVRTALWTAIFVLGLISTK